MTAAAASETPGQRRRVASRTMAAIKRAADAWPMAVCSAIQRMAGAKATDASPSAMASWKAT